MIVVDASIFVKLLKEEDDSDRARSFIDHMLAKGEGYLSPSVVLYESLSAALHVEVPLDTVGNLFEEFRALGLVMEEPSQADLKLAETIARKRSPVGGYPTLFDSIYHAMAIQRGGMFVTADARHVAKAGQFGHVTLLADWKPD
ncbi:type II toxin-antitoxin system VapC family toxin [Mesorhizobium sp. IMUNJ 23232]|uniref:type II toxin-antitoxin system VapC family toxin n=1 Tax=Mesorhizobium sp. IMUNJ 23232 TaxID=3376064 RepID=UPI003787CA1E